MRTTPLAFVVATCLATFISAPISSALPVQADPDYHLEIPLVTPFVQGGINLTSVELRVGINDAGTIAFTGNNDAAGGSQAFVLDPDTGTATRVSFAAGSASRNFLGAAINDGAAPRMATRDRVTGNPTHYLVRSWETTNPGNWTTIGTTTQSHFDSAASLVDINDAGIVCFSALINGSSQTSLMAGSGGVPTTLATFTGNIFVRPAISNTNEIVIRDDSNRILCYDYPGGSSELISTGFSAVDVMPSITKDGTVISFSGDRGSGAGVFCSVRHNASRTIFRMAGEGVDGLTFINGFQRVGVTASGDPSTGLRVTVVFDGILNGDQGIYAASAEITENGPMLDIDLDPLLAVVRNGNTIGSKTTVEFELNDPINASGAIAFHASFTDGSVGIVRALPCNLADRVFGKVVMGANRVPMQGVLAELLDTGDNVVACTETDEDGEYCVSPVPTGTYRLRASIEYVETTTSDNHTVSNYPGFDAANTFAYTQGTAHELDDVVFPEPVFLQGGLFGGLSTWDTLKAYFVEDPRDNADKLANDVPAFLATRQPSGGGGYNNKGLSTNNHDSNGALLAGLITGFDLSSWIDPADLSQIRSSVIGHSMGGLITRAMVTNDSSVPVDRIICLDSPHGGSFPTALTPLFALQERTLNGISLLPFTAPVFHGWNQSHIEPGSSPRDWLLYACVNNPVVLPDTSSYGFGRSVLGLAGVPSGWRGNWVRAAVRHVVDIPDSHGGSHETLARLRECALYLANGVLPPGAMPQPPPAPSGPPVDDLGVVASAVAATATSTASDTFEMDSNTLVYASVLVQGAGASLEVRDSMGTPLTLENLVSDTFEPGATVHTFELTAPPTGSTEVRLTAGPVEDAQLDATFSFDNGNRLAVGAIPDTIDASDPIQITAWIEDSVPTILIGTSPGFSAIVVHPDGSTSAVPLFDDGLHGDGPAGDGVFGEAFASTSLEGFYSVFAHGESDVLGETIEREQATGFLVTPTGATFVGTPLESTPDADVDLLFDALVLDQDVGLTRDGVFKLVGELRDASDALIADVAAHIDNDQGPTTVTAALVVLADDLARHGEDGPWTLTALTLLDEELGSAPMEVAADHVTLAYALADFEVPAPPVILDLVPAAGPISGGNEITIVGEGLLDTLGVLVGGKPAPFVVTGHQTLRVTVPGITRRSAIQQLGPPATPPTVRVVVRTRWGGTTSPDVFRYEN